MTWAMSTKPPSNSGCSKLHDARANDFAQAKEFAGKLEPFLNTRVLSWAVQVLVIEEKEVRYTMPNALQRMPVGHRHGPKTRSDVSPGGSPPARRLAAGVIRRIRSNEFFQRCFRDKGGSIRIEGGWFRIGFLEWKIFQTAMLRSCVRKLRMTNIRMSNEVVKKFFREKLQLCAAVGGLGAAASSCSGRSPAFLPKPVLGSGKWKVVNRFRQEKWRALACGGEA